MNKSEQGLYDRLIQDIAGSRSSELYYRGVVVRQPTAYPFLNEIIDRLMKDVVAMQHAAELIRKGLLSKTQSSRQPPTKEP